MLEKILSTMNMPQGRLHQKAQDILRKHSEPCSLFCDDSGLMLLDILGPGKTKTSLRKFEMDLGIKHKKLPWEDNYKKGCSK